MNKHRTNETVGGRLGARGTKGPPQISAGIGAKAFFVQKALIFGSWASMVLQNYQHFIELTSNMIYIVAFGGGLKCLQHNQASNFGLP